MSVMVPNYCKRERAKEKDENCFVSPAVITHKKDKSVKIVLNLRKLNEIAVKKNAQMPNVDEMLSRISRKNADGRHDGIWISKLDLDYAHGQKKLSDKAEKAFPIHDLRRKIHQLLSIPDKILRVSRSANKRSRNNRYNTPEHIPHG